MGFAAGRNFLAPPYYSQHAVFASPLSAFIITHVLLYISTIATTQVNYHRLVCLSTASDHGIHCPQSYSS